jgi:HK97 family phage major capsid protein
MKDTITALQQARAAANARIQALAAVEAANGELNAEQLQEFEAAMNEFNSIEAKISRLRAAEAAAASTATSVSDAAAVAGAAAAASATHVEPALKLPTKPGMGVARMARALAASKGDPRRAAEFAERNGFGADVAASLNMGSDSAGGILVPANLAAEVIEILRPKAVIRRLGARTLPLPNGNLTVPRLNGGAVVGYIGTDTDIPSTGQTFDDLKLSAKKLAALVPISNDLLAYSGVNPNVDQIVVDDLTGAVAAREDKAFIRDDGTGNTPKGLKSWMIPGNVLHAPDLTGLSGQALYTAIDQFLGSLILLLENANSNLTNPGWVMAPRTKRFLADFRDGNGNKFYPELAQGMLKGYPVGSTTQVPNNLGAGANQSEIYFADFGDCFIGETEQLRIDYSSEATYKDTDGNVVSAFQRDQTLVRVITYNDFGPRHVESIAMADQVTWGVGA